MLREKAVPIQGGSIFISITDEDDEMWWLGREKRDDAVIKSNPIKTTRFHFKVPLGSEMIKTSFTFRMYGLFNMELKRKTKSMELPKMEGTEKDR